MRFRRLLYGIITILLSHSESQYRVSLALGTHVIPLCSSKHSGLGQMWVEAQHFLQQRLSLNPFSYCEEEQDLREEESGEHGIHLEDSAKADGAASGGYVEVQSAPYAYDQGAEAKRDDSKSTPLLWFSHPMK